MATATRHDAVGDAMNGATHHPLHDDVPDDVLDALGQLAREGWVSRRAESFRHIAPPGAAVWLGDDRPSLDSDRNERTAARSAGDAPPCAVRVPSGWQLHALDAGALAAEARWLDAGDRRQRAELYAHLPDVDRGDAAPFEWAHRALCRDGLVVRVPAAREGAAGGSVAPVRLAIERTPSEQVEAPVLRIELAPSAHAVLVERHVHAADVASACGIVQNLRVSVRLGAGASLHHLRVIAPAGGDRIAHHLEAHLGRGASYRLALVASGSDYHLQRTALVQAGDGATARFGAALLAHGAALDQQISVAHEASRSDAAVETVALASGDARVVSNAYSTIAPGADDASARQRLVGIPVAGRPRVVLRPQLEIHHDRVQAAHGATWGTLPEDALFYAAQRGLDEHEARALIVQGLARAVLERCLAGMADDGERGVDSMLERALDDTLATTVARQLGAQRMRAPGPGPSSRDARLGEHDHG